MTVSVVIPAYNAARTIVTTIESVMAQSYRPMEIIVVDDGSTDTTQEVVARHPEVEYVRQDNAGVSSARNRGIQESTGDFIAFVDSDDIWFPHKLERQVRALIEAPHAGAVQSGAVYVDDRLRVLEVRACPAEHLTLSDVLQFKGLPAFPSTVCFRRGCLEQIGGFDSTLVILEDWDMAIRAVRHCSLLSIPEPLTYYRVHPGNRSRDVGIHIAPGFRVLNGLFAESCLPPSLRRERRTAYGSFYRMLAGGYLRSGRRMASVRWAVRALLMDPRQALYMLGLPARVMRRHLQRIRG